MLTPRPINGLARRPINAQPRRPAQGRTTDKGCGRTCVFNTYRYYYRTWPTNCLIPHKSEDLTQTTYCSIHLLFPNNNNNELPWYFQVVGNCDIRSTQVKSKNSRVICCAAVSTTDLRGRPTSDPWMTDATTSYFQTRSILCLISWKIYHHQHRHNELLVEFKMRERKILYVRVSINQDYEE